MTRLYIILGTANEGIYPQGRTIYLGEYANDYQSKSSMANQISKTTFQEEAFKFPRTWPHLTEFKYFTYNYSKENVPKINDY